MLEKIFTHAYMLDTEVSIKALKYFAGWADKIHGQTIPSGEYMWETGSMTVEERPLCGAGYLQIVPGRGINQLGKLLFSSSF